MKNIFGIKLIFILIGFLIGLFLFMPLALFNYGVNPPWYIKIPNELIAFSSNLIHEFFLITDEEILERKLKKSMITLKDLSTTVTKFHEINPKVLTSIDELEPLIKDEYAKIYANENKIMDYEKYLHQRIYDEFGSKFYVDSQNYEIYCINPDVVKKIYNKISSKKEYTLSYINYRILFDCIYIEKLKRQFLNKEKRLPTNIKELKTEIQFEKWGMKYELDNKANEIIITYPDGKFNKFQCNSLNIY